MQARARLLGLFGLLGLLGLLPAFAEQPALVRFAVIGDSGTGNNHQQRIARQMLAWHDRLPYDLTLMLGDNIYGGLFGLGGGNRKDFARKFDRPYAALRARGVVFRAALGNHDLRHRKGQDLVEAYDRFHIDGPHGYYNFTAGQMPDGTPLVEFFVLNTGRLEKNQRDPAQLAWLEAALAASAARWRVAYFHHPIYSAGDRHGEDKKLRAKLEPLFLGSVWSGPVRAESASKEKQALAPAVSGSGASAAQRRPAPRVQVVLSGHNHIYERFHPRQGILYFVVGASGKLRRGNARPRPDLAGVNDQTHSFLLVEATPNELRFLAIDETGHAFDCATLHRDATVRVPACPATEANTLSP
ncbi:MAG: metallophosphoesterase [Terriglobia bacterium]